MRTEKPRNRAAPFSSINANQNSGSETEGSGGHGGAMVSRDSVKCPTPTWGDGRRAIHGLSELWEKRAVRFSHDWRCEKSMGESGKGFSHNQVPNQKLSRSEASMRYLSTSFGHRFSIFATSEVTSSSF